MKNKSFILCIAGIVLLVVMGCYVFGRDGGMQPKMDTADKQTEQEKNSVDNPDNNENEADFLAFNDDVSGNYQIDVSEQKEDSDISKINNYNNPIDEYFEPYIDGTESMAEATRRGYERLYKYVWKTEYENIMEWMKKKCKYSEDKEDIEKMEESVDNYIESALSVMETEMIDGYNLDPSVNRIEGNGVYSSLDRICGTMYRDISMKLINLSEGNGKPYNFMERDYSEIIIP